MNNRKMERKTILMPDMMKVEHNVRVLQEARSLEKAGFHVRVIGFSNKTRKRRFTVEGIDVVSFYLHDARSGKGKVYRYWSGLMTFLGITLYTLTHRADYYHAHNFHVLPACWLAAKLIGGKLIYDTHETWTIHRDRKYHPEHVFAFLSEWLFLRGIDGFITVNEMIVEYYQRFYKLKKRSEVLYNTREVVPPGKKDLIRQLLPISPENKIILFVGGLWPNGRGIFELIDSSVYLDPSFRVVFLGYGSDAILSRMKARIRELNKTDIVYILPPQPPGKVLDFIMSADIGMNLIRRESRAQDFQSPWKLFEYCMGGLPVVSTDLPFHRKVYRRFDIGALCRTENDPKDIAQTISRVFNSTGFNKFHEQARLAAEEEFNWGVQERKLIRLYNGF